MIPAVINGCSRSAQPEMWRKYYQNVFKAENAPYNGDIFNEINSKILYSPVSSINISKFNISEMNVAISVIDTNKSYSRHFHWKYLNSAFHNAKLCLLRALNTWSHNVLCNKRDLLWRMFDTNLKPTPKPNKRDMSSVKSWRPISIGTSENWLLEKIFLERLKPYVHTDDSQFGYKPNHSTSHAIELVRVLERTTDTHVCLLDASAAFDSLSWYRVRDQLLKRKVPLSLLKLVLKQLISNRISVCFTKFIYPRAGTKQGGVLSGYIFSACYDDLVSILKTTACGVLYHTFDRNFILICVIIYADDIFLMARSPGGLKTLIERTFCFAHEYDDLKFNAAKSWILRLGPHRRPPVSVLNIPTTECYNYLGVQIGREAKPEHAAATSLYRKCNIMISQNNDLKKCCIPIKNMAIKSYGNVYASSMCRQYSGYYNVIKE